MFGVRCRSNKEHSNLGHKEKKLRSQRAPDAFSTSGSAASLAEDDPMNPGVILVLDVIGNDHETFTNVHSHMYNTTRVFTLNIQDS